MKQGDFTALAKSYANRVGYSDELLRIIPSMIKTGSKTLNVADVGAGTGKLTENLLDLGYKVSAVEPNDAMREEGIRHTHNREVKWAKGSGEETGLASQAYDWVLMGSSFHWVNSQRGLAEFHRILKPGGVFTAVWNPRDLERSEFQKKIDEKIKEFVPELKRVSSGSKDFTSTLFETMTSTDQFENIVFMEAKMDVKMTRERYLGLWESVNDIQAQAGPERWESILNYIKSATQGMKEVVSPYATRAWTGRRKN